MTTTKGTNESTTLTAPAVYAAHDASNERNTPEVPGNTTTQETTMTTTTKARTKGRFARIGQIAAVGAVALTLAGAAAGSADAYPRSAATRYASSSIAFCFDTGGDPTAYDFGGSWQVVCVYEDAWWSDDFYYDVE